ncbi:MAG: acyltransferase family protein [Lachnospiraceae bacterium]|nr:acyltransferase family protein [Lachnospiraceae bacterium]
MYSLMFSFIVLIGFICLILAGCHKRDIRIETRESYLQMLNGLRGIFALEIVVGHVVRNERILLYPLGKFMICSVAYFFFVSAFGMAVSFEKKKNYLSYKFLISKPLYLFIISFIFYLVDMVIDYVCRSDLNYVTPGVPKAFFVTTNWYIWELIGFYILFFCVYKYMPKFRIPLVAGITIILSVVMYYSGFKETYIASSFAFPMGLLFGEYFENVKQFLFSFKGFFMTVTLSIFGMSCFLIKNENVISMVFMRNAIGIATILIIFFACTRYTLGEGQIVIFLSKYSTEIYLSQFVWLRLTESLGWNYMIRLPFVVAATIIMAVLMHPIVHVVRKQCSCRLAKELLIDKK